LRTVSDISTFENEAVNHYLIKDHLGNTRTIINEGGEVEEEMSYYPYGLQIAELNYKKSREQKKRKMGRSWSGNPKLWCKGTRSRNSTLVANRSVG
jgi:hypothetical protein